MEVLAQWSPINLSTLSALSPRASCSTLLMTLLTKVGKFIQKEAILTLALWNTVCIDTMDDLVFITLLHAPN